MDEAIKKLERKRKEWRERAEYHRQEAMRYHGLAEYMRRDEHRELEKLAVDNVAGLDYAIALLKTT